MQTSCSQDNNHVATHALSFNPLMRTTHSLNSISLIGRPQIINQVDTHRSAYLAKSIDVLFSSIMHIYS
jgi:hypothetical protein